MRIAVILLCITGFLAKDIARLSWEIWFKVNQAEIIAEKCENKAIPMMHCNGKCYLAKKLQKIEQKEQNHNSKTNPYAHLLKADWISSNATNTIDYNSVALEEARVYPVHSTEQLRDYQEFVFHPPTI